MRPYHRKLRGEPMRVLVRHADAGLLHHTGAEFGPTVAGSDQWRGLSPTGHAQAEELVTRLDGLPIVRVLASPALRCRQTVLPLARELAVEVEPCRTLAEDADPAEVMRLLSAAETENAVLCTHREVLLGVFAQFAITGSRLIDGVARMELAAAWELYGSWTAPARLRLLRPGNEPGGQQRRCHACGNALREQASRVG